MVTLKEIAREEHRCDMLPEGRFVGQRVATREKAKGVVDDCLRGCLRCQL